MAVEVQRSHSLSEDVKELGVKKGEHNHLAKRILYHHSKAFRYAHSVEKTDSKPPRHDPGPERSWAVSTFLHHILSACFSNEAVSLNVAE